MAVDECCILALCEEGKTEGACLEWEVLKTCERDQSENSSREGEVMAMSMVPLAVRGKYFRIWRLKQA